MNSLLTGSRERFGFQQLVLAQLLTFHDLGRVTKPANFIFSKYRSTIISVTEKEFLLGINGRGLGSYFSAPRNIGDCKGVKSVGFNLHMSSAL